MNHRLLISRAVDTELLSFESDNYCGNLNIEKERGKPSLLRTGNKSLGIGGILPKT